VAAEAGAAEVKEHMIQTGDIRALIPRSASVLARYGPDGNEVRPFFLVLGWWACGTCEAWGCHDTYIDRDEAIKRHVAG
jgi:hypothetical protein